MSIKVECTIDECQVLVNARELVVKSHNVYDYVKIMLGAESIIVSGDELIQAIKNAQNTGR